jgi:hypothetical protein
MMLLARLDWFATLTAFIFLLCDRKTLMIQFRVIDVISGSARARHYDFLLLLANNSDRKLSNLSQGIISGSHNPTK